MGRTKAYQPRKLKREDLVNTEGITCPRCGKLVSSLVYVQDAYLFDWWRDLFREDNGKILKFLSRKYKTDLSEAVVEKKNFNNITITTKTHNITLRLVKYSFGFGDSYSMYLNSDSGKEETFYVQRVGAKLNVYDNIHDVCRRCRIEIETDKLEGARKEIRRKNLELADKFHDLLDECEKKGTCDILAAHRELLKSDDDRLKTSTLLDLICKNRYDDKWNEILDKAKAKIESERFKIKMGVCK